MIVHLQQRLYDQVVCYKMLHRVTARLELVTDFVGDWIGVHRAIVVD